MSKPRISAIARLEGVPTANLVAASLVDSAVLPLLGVLSAAQIELVRAVVSAHIALDPVAGGLLQAVHLRNELEQSPLKACGKEKR
jgi:hypothetical protein